jgi:hypothetical protein
MAQDAGPSRAQEVRLFAGLAVQPFVAAAVGFMMFPLIEWSNSALRRGTSGDLVDGAVAVAAGAGLAAFFVTLLGALPIVVWRMRRGPLTLRQVLLGGALLGNLPFAVIVPLAAAAGGSGAGWFWPLGAIRALAVGAVFGMAGAAVFWAIAVRGTGLGAGR